MDQLGRSVLRQRQLRGRQPESGRERRRRPLHLRRRGASVRSGSADVDYDAVFVPTAGVAHSVRNLGIAATGAEAAGWSI